MGKLRHRTTQQNSNLLCKNLFRSLCILKCFQTHMAQNEKAEHTQKSYFVRDGVKALQATVEHNDHTQNTIFISFHSR